MQTLKRNIFETAKSSGGFTTLLAAIEAAGLKQTLATEGPFTVFAPNDEAFKKIPAETIQQLLKDQDQLTQVLTFHVLSGKHAASEVVKLSQVKTLQGSVLPVKVSGSNVFIGDAKVVTTDLECENGIVHVIDSVLFPQ